MSDKFIPYHLRNINQVPDYLNEDQKQSWIRAAVKAKENQQLKHDYSPFDVPQSLYEVIFINKYVTIETMEKIIVHARECTQYSLDTESEISNKKLALIQIQSIPKQTPSFMILLELFYLPDANTYTRAQVRQFFQLVFKSGNIIYGWGPIKKELEPALEYDLFKWPIDASIENIQLLFPNWYQWAMTHCESCNPDYSREAIVNDKDLDGNKKVFLCCTCHRPSPYQHYQLWGLQKALLYTCNMFIDKSTTINHWSKSLDPVHSTLSSNTRKKMVRYAIYDCFVTTYLAQPVMNNWTFQQIMDANVIDLFKESTPKSTSRQSNKQNKKIKKNINVQKLFNFYDDDDLEPISDDEIYLNQLIGPVINTKQDQGILNDKHEFNIKLINNEENELSIKDDNHDGIDDTLLLVNVINDMEVPVDTQNWVVNDEHIHDENDSEHVNNEFKNQNVLINKSSNQRRTREARTKRNKKRNNVRRMRRYQYHLNRRVYYKFKPPLVKKILKQYGIHFKHVKVENEMLIIGVRKDLIRRYQQQLPHDMFNRKNYQVFRCQYRRK